MSHLIMSTHRLRQSVIFDDEDMDISIDNRPDLQPAAQSSNEPREEPAQANPKNVESAAAKPEPEVSKSSSRRKSVKIRAEAEVMEISVPEIQVTEPEHEEPMDVDIAESSEQILNTVPQIVASTPMRRGRKSRIQDSSHLSPKWKSTEERKTARLHRSTSRARAPGKKSTVTFDASEPEQTQTATPLQGSNRKSVAVEKTEPEETQTATPLKRSRRISVAVKDCEPVKNQFATPLKRSSRKSVAVPSPESENSRIGTPLKTPSRKSAAATRLDTAAEVSSPVRSGRKSMAASRQADTEPEIVQSTTTRSSRKSVRTGSSGTPLRENVGEKRKSVARDLISFETPEALTPSTSAPIKTPRKTPRPKSIARSVLDSDYPTVEILPLTPRRSTRASMQIARTPYK